MKKTIALLVTLMIVLLPLSVVVASTSELTWGMSKQEVINSLGEPEETNTLNDAITSDAETIIYTNQKISKYEDAALILFFRGDGLYCKDYAVYDDNSHKSTYLCNALTQKYGNSSKEIILLKTYIESVLSVEADEDMIDFIIASGYIKDVATWRLEDESTIVLLRCRLVKDI